MDACFLFSKHLDENGCYCLKLSKDGTVLAELDKRSFDEIKTLQEGADTLVIESASQASFFELELPWLAEKKARAAIPYALEESLAQATDELHFAFDKQHYQNNRYFICVIPKARLNEIKIRLHDTGIAFQAITLDWFALDRDELCITESSLLIYQADYKGALTGDLASTYLKQHPALPVLCFEDNTLISEQLIPIETPHDPSHWQTQVLMEKGTSHTWIARRLLKSKPMNLCQGEMQEKKSLMKTSHQILIALCAFWFFSIIFVNVLSYYSLKKQIKAVDEQIAHSYHTFFPEAKEVINPRFRIQQLLTSYQTKSPARLWFLLTELANALPLDSMHVESFNYQSQRLALRLTSPDFISLEKLEHQLRTKGIEVKQTEASTQEKQVIATLELA